LALEAYSPRVKRRAERDYRSVKVSASRHGAATRYQLPSHWLRLPSPCGLWTIKPRRGAVALANRRACPTLAVVTRRHRILSKIAQRLHAFDGSVGGLQPSGCCGPLVRARGGHGVPRRRSGLAGCGLSARFAAEVLGVRGDRLGQPRRQCSRTSPSMRGGNGPRVRIPPSPCIRSPYARR
jgi:hypothetical protein